VHLTDRKSVYVNMRHSSLPLFIRAQINVKLREKCRRHTLIGLGRDAHFNGTAPNIKIHFATFSSKRADDLWILVARSSD
jgi:hypothetical protein